MVGPAMQDQRDGAGWRKIPVPPEARVKFVGGSSWSRANGSRRLVAAGPGRGGHCAYTLHPARVASAASAFVSASAKPWVRFANPKFEFGSLVFAMHMARPDFRFGFEGAGGGFSSAPAPRSRIRFGFGAHELRSRVKQTLAIVSPDFKL